MAGPQHTPAVGLFFGPVPAPPAGSVWLTLGFRAAHVRSVSAPRFCCLLLSEGLKGHRNPSIDHET